MWRSRRTRQRILTLTLPLCLIFICLSLFLRHRQTTHLHENQLTCSEQKNVAFLKVHKTGSSTITNILQRFGYQRGSNFALPKKTPGERGFNYFGGVGETTSLQKMIPFNPEESEYNILCNHVIFNVQEFQKIFPPYKSKYITLLREPSAQFKSSALFFIHGDVKNITTTNISAYFNNPLKYEPKNPYISFTNNRQSLDLGMDPKRLREIEYIETYIKILNDSFDLVMINEYFDESLVLLKRHLCWSLKDILYFRQNEHYMTRDFNLSAGDRMLQRKWLMADNLLYEHFLKEFWRKLDREDRLVEEVKHFREIQKATWKFCNSNATSPLEIERSPWNSKFEVTNLNCMFMRLDELDFQLKLMHDRYIRREDRISR